MNKIEMSKNPDYYFAALKLIEQLYKDGRIPNFMYRNILNEYADIIVSIPCSITFKVDMQFIVLYLIGESVCIAG